MPRTHYFEDYTVGETIALPPVTLTEEDILAWANEYDKRPFHRSVEEAKASAFGRLIASGIHTMAASWAPWLAVVAENDEGLVAGMGIDFAKWPAPVFPGDTLTGTLTIVDKKIFSRGDSGSVTMRIDAQKEDGTQVLSFQMVTKHLLRDPQPAAPKTAKTPRPAQPQRPEDLPVTTGHDVYKRKKLYFEDYAVGQKWLLAPYSFSEDDIVTFAKKYDPVDLHSNPEAAKASVFGGVIASGMQTIAGAWSAWTDLNLEVGALVAGMGIDYATWAAPVFPGDALTTLVSVEETRLFSKGDAGSMRLRFDVWNQDGTYVANFAVTMKIMARKKAIDTHAHLWSTEYLDLLEEYGADGSTRIARSLHESDSEEDLAYRFDLMDKAGVSMQILSATPQLPQFGSAEQAAAAARKINDLYLDLVLRFPDRFLAYAALPLPYVDEAIAEAKRVLALPEFKGIALNTILADGTSLADDAFAPLYEYLNEQHATIYVHPTGNGACSSLVNDFHLEWVVGAPLEDGLAILHLLKKDIPRRFPHLRFHIAHLGGFVPFMMQRIEDNYTDWNAFQESPWETIRQKFWFDAASFHEPALRTTAETFGIDHIFMGSDYPYFLDQYYVRAADYIRNAKLDPHEIDLILSGNAIDFFGIDPAVVHVHH